MAKQSAGFLGGFSGRLGPAVGYMWNGKWCLRSHQQFVHNPRTAAQVEHRELFKQQVQLAAKMRCAVIKTFTDLAREAGMTSYNLFVKVNQPAFSAAEGLLQVDYSRLRMSVGDVAPVELTELQRTEDNILRVRWSVAGSRWSVGGSRYATQATDHQPPTTVDRFDYVYLYVYAPDVEVGFISAPAYRMDKRLALQLPDLFAGHELQVYLLVQSQDGRWSDSQYVGAISQGETLDAETGEVRKESGKRKMSSEQWAVSSGQEADAPATGRRRRR